MPSSFAFGANARDAIGLGTRPALVPLLEIRMRADIPGSHVEFEAHLFGAMHAREEKCRHRLR
jgi:hypothetical protein